MLRSGRNIGLQTIKETFNDGESIKAKSIKVIDVEPSPVKVKEEPKATVEVKPKEKTDYHSWVRMLENDNMRALTKNNKLQDSSNYPILRVPSLPMAPRMPPAAPREEYKSPVPQTRNTLNPSVQPQQSKTVQEIIASLSAKNPDAWNRVKELATQDSRKISGDTYSDQKSW